MKVMIITEDMDGTQTREDFTLTDEEVQFLRQEHDDMTLPQALRDVIEFWVETNIGDGGGTDDVP